MTIDLDFVAARQKAKELRETAADLRNMANRQYEDTIANITICWKSDNSGIYIAKANKLKADMLKSAVKLEHLSDNILKYVKQLEDAENEAQQIINTLSH